VGVAQATQRRHGRNAEHLARGGAEGGAYTRTRQQMRSLITAAKWYSTYEEVGCLEDIARSLNGARLPCLATRTPAPATTNAAQVEMSR
jgi:hypothetical protein